MGKVRLVREDGMPVRDVEQRREGIAAQPREIDLGSGGGASESTVQDDEEPDGAENEEEGRQQASGAAGPKGSELDGGGRGPLFEQQRGDQEPREHEEEVDPQIPPLCPAESQVVGEHAGNRKGSYSVEAREVASGDRQGHGRIAYGTASPSSAFGPARRVAGPGARYLAHGHHRASRYTPRGRRSRTIRRIVAARVRSPWETIPTPHLDECSARSGLGSCFPLATTPHPLW